MNHKRVHRVYREAWLICDGRSGNEGKLLVARTTAKQAWALDFMQDVVECERPEC
jgi:hypothetical protein